MVRAGHGQIVFNYKLCKQYLGLKDAQIFISGEELGDLPNVLLQRCFGLMFCIPTCLDKFVTPPCAIFMPLCKHCSKRDNRSQTISSSRDRPTVRRTPNDSVAGRVFSSPAY